MAGAPVVLNQAFHERFGCAPELFRAPGRVNLIGEHTDYNLGFVLPIAIHLACYTASAPNAEGQLRVFAYDYGEERSWPIDQIRELRPTGDWTDYVIGVARQLPELRPTNLMILSTVPVGAGLSSSAALEVAAALALGWTQEGRPRVELAKLCQRVENDFVGMPSGIMDQYISVMGQANAALKVDCRSLESEAVPLPAEVAFMAVNSGVKHELGETAYRTRVAECAAAVAAIQEHCPEVKSLRDAEEDQLRYVADGVVRRRARHVIREDQRVLEFTAAARAGDARRMGELFVASHRSLQFDYEVSCAELDFLVDTAIGIPGVYGARMTGGGFGGCTVNLLVPDAIARFKEEIQEAYRRRFNREAAFYEVRPAAGAGKINLEG